MISSSKVNIYILNHTQLPCSSQVLHIISHKPMHNTAPAHSVNHRIFHACPAIINHDTQSFIVSFCGISFTFKSLFDSTQSQCGTKSHFMQCVTKVIVSAFAIPFFRCSLKASMSIGIYFLYLPDPKIIPTILLSLTAMKERLFSKKSPEEFQHSFNRFEKACMASRIRREV